MEEGERNNENNIDEINESVNTTYEQNNIDYEFKELSKYPSFKTLQKDEQQDILDKIDEILLKGRNEKWLIDFNELTIGKNIGEGSNSYVNVCTWRGLNIVVKRPKYKKLCQLLDILKEIQMWSNIRHPYLVQFLGVSYDEQENDFYILLEKIDGENLGEHIHNKTSSKTKSINKYAKYQICIQLINVIKFLHTCKPPIIYRDLKPENIMIDKFNNVKLTDFGLSRYMPEESKYKLTGGTGTIRYMAPEVYLGQKYDLKADVYSLGFILYYIIGGKKPFNEYNVDTIRTYMENTDLIHSLDIIKDKKWRELINNCIKKDTEERWDVNTLFENITNITNNAYNNENKPCLIS
tara:strand:+ start:94 stop:1146 length:1053 start_codon:yes stop_codon:yes gene_type:complete